MFSLTIREEVVPGAGEGFRGAARAVRQGGEMVFEIAAKGDVTVLEHAAVNPLLENKLLTSFQHL